MVKRHLKRLLAPRFWKVRKKKRKWAPRPRPGPHAKFESIPLLLIVRDILRLTDTAKEAKSIVKSRGILVDGRPKSDHKYPVGLMDTLEIPKLRKRYRIVPSPKGLEVVEIPATQARLKLCKIINKTTIKGGKIQLNLHDGRNVIISVKDPKKPKEDVYKTGDSLLIELPNQKIKDHVRMKKGNLAMITSGQNRGKIVKIKEVIVTRSREPNKVVCSEKKRDFEAIKDYVFVVGKKKPLIKISG